LALRLRQGGAAVEEKTYPGVSHSGTVVALSRPFRSDVPVLDDIVAFFDAVPQFGSGQSRAAAAKPAAK
jgi:hypothetical protein